MIFKFYKVGDYIKVNGEEGMVEVVDVFYIFLIILDYKYVVLLNGLLVNGNLVNYIWDEICRIDLVVGVSYNIEFDDVEKVLIDMMK